MKPDYSDPHIQVTGEVTKDKIAIHKQHLKKIQLGLDESIQNGWTLVYFDRFLNTVIITNGGNDVTDMDYAITRLIQKTIGEAFKK